MNHQSCTRFSQENRYHTCSKRILGPCYLKNYSIMNLNELWLSNVSTMGWRSPKRYLCSAIMGWQWGSCCLRWWNWDNDSSSWSIPLVCISNVALLCLNFDSERDILLMNHLWRTPSRPLIMLKKWDLANGLMEEGVSAKNLSHFLVKCKQVATLWRPVVMIQILTANENKTVRTTWCVS
jgi:hypothetical protein